MAKVTGFLEIDRRDRRYAPASDRIRHYKEFLIPLSEEATKDQAARCMNCGIPYCHNGCPVNNQIPDWNDLVYRSDWQEASRNLHSTNNFPEFTGRVCPAPCEASCTLNIQDDPVTIKTIECAIVDRAWEQGWIKPEPAEIKTGKSVASLVETHDAVALAGGAEAPRDLPAPGRDLSGVHFAMDFLPQQNRRVSGEPVGTNEPIVATGKYVVVIGGGDTGSDCIGTSIRQGALKVTQLEIMPMPPKAEDKLLTWPNWPLKLRTSSSHEEGAERDFAVMTKRFEGENGAVSALECVRVDDKMKPVAGSEFTLRADLVLLAM